jgi:small subunit ribosomal protein S8
MYTDLLTKIRNAQAAQKEMLKTPYSNMDYAIAELLAKRGFIDGVQKKGRLPKRVLEIRLKYEGRKGAITGVKFLSTPGIRTYGGYRDLRSVRQGYGMSVLSTAKGVMASDEAKKAKVGGALLFEIW